MNCCARSARFDQQLTRYQSVCSWRSPPSERPVTRLTATLNSHTGRPFGVMRSSGSRPTLPMITILLTDATLSLVPSHYEVAKDVFGEANSAFELACLRGRKRELDDAVLAALFSFPGAARGRWVGGKRPPGQKPGGLICSVGKKRGPGESGGPWRN